MTVEEYLRTKNTEPRGAPGEWLIRCIFCNDSNHPRHRHLYVNREHGAFKCHRCQAQGSFRQLQEAFGDRPLRLVTEGDEAWQIYSYAVSVCEDILLDYRDVLKYLHVERGLSSETIGKHRLGFADRTFFDRMRERYTLDELRAVGLVSAEANQPLFNNALVIPYFRKGVIVNLRAKIVGGKTIGLAGVPTFLYMAHNIDDVAYICEGELDALLLDQMGYPAVGIPGAGAFKDTWIPLFGECKRVYVVLDQDEAGRTGAVRISELMPAKTSIVHLPLRDGASSVDITEFFLRDGHTQHDFDQLVAASHKRRLVSVKEAFADRDALYSQRGLELGFRDLDHLLSPGLLPGQLAVLLAKTGIGKTAFITQLVYNMSRNQVPVMLLSLEQTRGEIAERLERIYNFSNSHASRDDLVSFYDSFLLCDENRVTPDYIEVLLDEFVERKGQPPKVLFVDYLGYWSRGFRGASQYEQVSAAVMELKRIAKEHSVVVFAPHQVSRAGRRGQRLELDYARDSGVIEETADFAFGLWAPNSSESETPLDELERALVFLDVLKSRHGGSGYQSRLLWAPLSLSMLPKLPEYGFSVKREWQLLDQGVSYPSFLAQRKGLVDAAASGTV